MNRVDYALERFTKDFNCAQSVFSSYAPDFGINDETALKLAFPFGGGMGQQGLVCGAVSGALMVIGLKHGITDPKDKEGKDRANGLVKDFMEEFKGRNNNTLICKELLGCDGCKGECGSEDEEKALKKRMCPKFVKDAVEILEDILKS